MAKRNAMKDAAEKMARIVRNIRASHLASGELGAYEALAMNVAAYLVENATEMRLAQAIRAVDNSSAVPKGSTQAHDRG